MRYPAIPLVTVDPYFSIWSFNNSLYTDSTKHWTGKSRGMTGLISIDGVCYRFMGKINPKGYSKYPECPIIKQTSCEITALSTTYTFEAPEGVLILSFTTPMLMDDLKLMSTPITYINFDYKSSLSQKQDVKIYFDISSSCATDTNKQEVSFSKVNYRNAKFIKSGRTEQEVLCHSGDDIRIEWGYLTLVGSKNTELFQNSCDLRNAFSLGKELNSNFDMVCNIKKCRPVLAAVLNSDTGTLNEMIAVAYDDVKSVHYFGEDLDAYYKKDGESFDTAILNAFNDYDNIKLRCDEFDEKFSLLMHQTGGADYEKLTTLSYRQAIAAHKLALSPNGEALFFSKECFSNGCMATVDVTYPTMPLFLVFNTELVKAMLRPILEYSISKHWHHNFAPHDVGVYPIARGQKYPTHMPVEECGNMLISIAAVCLTEKNCSFAEEYIDLLKKWVTYLVKYGLDPKNQLCTDDFSGKLPHNTNLSLKAIMGIACFSFILSQLGEKEESQKYMNTAKEYAKSWQERAFDRDHYKLAFDKEDTWSLKYNMVWDDIFGFSLFPQSVKETEVNYYLSMKKEFGTPLDSRANYTKLDWLVWAATLSDNKAKFDNMIKPIMQFLRKTPTRVPLADWYNICNARRMYFQNRSVVGGVFIKTLKELLVERRSAAS